MALTDKINDGFIALTNLVKSNKVAISDNTALLPFKIGESWYKSGLYYDASYPFAGNIVGNAPGNQLFIGIPFKVLEDMTIKTLSVYCVTAQVGATSKIAIYDSNSDNTINNLLFGSGPLNMSTTGAKVANCNVALKKGQVVYLTSLSLSTGTTATVSALGAINTKAFGGIYAQNVGLATSFYKTGVTDLPTTAKNMTLSYGVVPRVMFSV